MKKMGLVLTLGMILTSCATIIKGDQQPLTVNSNVDGASVYLDGVINWNDSTSN